MQKNISKTLHNFLIISLGNLIYTVAVAFFILPNNLITGGTTGLALSVNICSIYRSQPLSMSSILPCSFSVPGSSAKHLP